MSAYLDKSQGITFVYSNIYDLYKQAKEAKLDSPFVAERSRVIKAEGSQTVEEFQPKEFPRPQGVIEAEQKAETKVSHPVTNLQKNLKDLSDAHEKLRFLLQELDALTKKK